MTEFGYAISSEEHAPGKLVRNAARAEESGFTFALISDHYLPWVDQQGHAPFIWTVLGGIAGATQSMRIGTGVTCPIIRYHPALIAQAAATAASMMEGRFFLGVGSGEFLNEHVYGDQFPPPHVRQDMLAEAIEVMRELWEGDWVHHDGTYYTVEEARLYTLPETAPDIMMAADGPEGARLAGEIADGLVAVSANPKLVEAFQEAGGMARPRFAQIAVCYNESEAEARRIAHKWWPTSALPSMANWDIRSPRLFNELVKNVSEEMVAKEIVCGPDPAKHIEGIRQYIDAGFDHVYIHQVGEDQEGFFRFYEREILPELKRQPMAAGMRGNGAKK